MKRDGRIEALYAKHLPGQSRSRDEFPAAMSDDAPAVAGARSRALLGGFVAFLAADGPRQRLELGAGLVRRRAGGGWPLLFARALGVTLLRVARRARARARRRLRGRAAPALARVRCRARSGRSTSRWCAGRRSSSSSSSPSTASATASASTTTPSSSAPSTLGFFAGAYVTEIVRGAIQSVDPGQTEAALSQGMTRAAGAAPRAPAAGGAPHAPADDGRVREPRQGLVAPLGDRRASRSASGRARPGPRPTAPTRSTCRSRSSTSRSRFPCRAGRDGWSGVRRGRDARPAARSATPAKIAIVPTTRRPRGVLAERQPADRRREDEADVGRGRRRRGLRTLQARPSAGSARRRRRRPRRRAPPTRPARATPDGEREGQRQRPRDQRERHHDRQRVLAPAEHPHGHVREGGREPAEHADEPRAPSRRARPGRTISAAPAETERERPPDMARRGLPEDPRREERHEHGIHRLEDPGVGERHRGERPRVGLERAQAEHAAQR